MSVVLFIQFKIIMYEQFLLQDAQGQTALHVACQNGHRSVRFYFVVFSPVKTFMYYIKHSTLNVYTGTQYVKFPWGDITYFRLLTDL